MKSKNKFMSKSQPISFVWEDYTTWKLLIDIAFAYAYIVSFSMGDSE